MHNVIPSGNSPQRVRHFDFLWVLGCSLIAFYFAAAIYISGKRLFWYDEVVTFHLATLPTISLLAQALLHSTDTMTPAYLLTVRLFTRMFSNSEVAARLPSVLAVSAGYLVVFASARRVAGFFGGILALAILMNSFLPAYAYEARSYAFYFFFSAVAVWIWLFSGKRWAPLLFGLCCFCGESYHYYFGLCLVPFACYELYGAIEQRSLHVSPKLIGGVAGILLSVGAELPFVRSVQSLSQGFWAVPYVGTLTQTYTDFFPNAALLVAIYFLWLVIARKNNTFSKTIDLTGPERLGWFFLLIPVAGFILAKLLTHAFYPRYFIGLLPGVTLAAASLACRTVAHRKWALGGVTVLFLATCLATELRAIHHPEGFDPYGQRKKTRQVLEVEHRLVEDGKHYIVPSDPLLFSELLHYASRKESVLLFADLSSSPSARFESNLALSIDHYWPQPMWNLKGLEEHATDAALIEPNEDLVEYLRSHGYRLTVRYSQPLQVLYLSR